MGDKKAGFTKKYLPAILVLVFLSTVCVFIFLGRINLMIDEKVTEILLTEVTSHRDNLERKMNMHYQELEGISSYISNFENYDIERVLEITKPFALKTEFKQIIMVFEDGRGYYSDGRVQEVGNYESYKKIMSGITRYSEPFSLVDSDEVLVALSVPVYDSSQRVIGILIGGYDIRSLIGMDFAHLYDNKGYAYVIDGKGDFLVNDKKISNYKGNFYEYCKDNILTEEQIKQIKQSIGQREVGCVLAKQADESRYVVYVPFEFSDWVICYSVLLVDAFKDYLFIMQYETYLIVAISIISIATILYIVVVSQKERRFLLRKAEYDSLTGLYNRQKLTDEITKYFKEGKRFGIAILDIDDFKMFNDTYGHPVGDMILKKIGRILKENLKGNLVSRLGGDEFVILINDVTNPDLVIKKLEQACKQISLIRLKDHPDIIVTCSCGLAIAPNDGDTREKLYRAADSALYVAKSLGKNKLAKY